MLVGGLVAASLFGISSVIVILLLYQYAGSDALTDDVGDVFTKLNTIAEYAERRLAAASEGESLPKPPQILANQTALRLALATTLAFNAILFTVAGMASGLSFTDLTRTLGLRRFQPRAVWRPIVACGACYIGILFYSTIISQLGIEFLVPNSTVPGGVLRDNTSLAIAFVLAVIAAPFVEELFFRGFLFGGLLRWGFWPAAAISATVFTLVHFDPGSIIPFFGIGLVMAHLFYARGTLWDSIVFHFVFNGTSFAILISQR